MAAPVLRIVAAACCSQFVPAAAGLRTRPAAEAAPALGVMNGHGVTKYRADRVRRGPRSDGAFWGDPGNGDASRYRGALDLMENVSWGWHHPEGVYNTIPVGAPLIDDDMNIYLGSDDAIRKFTASGDLLWSYGPRGQLAAAPSLLVPSPGGREAADAAQPSAEVAEVERELKPEGQTPPGSALGTPSFGQYRVGDRLRVRPGVGYHADGKDYYRSGDLGEITDLVTEEGGQQRAMITWQRTHHRSAAGLSALGKRFTRVMEKVAAVPMLVGSTTSGYVFAIDLDSGEELWVIQASNQIAGVKGAVSGKNGIVVAATKRCTDRYCYRYRNQTNPLSPGNQLVLGLVAADGSAAWQFRPQAPVWNFVPQYGKDGDTVMFSDYEGTTYCLDLQTGALKWQADGSMGTYSQAHAVYFPTLDMIYALGVESYDHRFCNPFPAPGILPHCGTWPGSPGWIRALNASSGRLRWDYDTNEPPASAGIGMMHQPQHTRLIITLGHNCVHNSPSLILAFDPHNGHHRWSREGPTLWSDYCAGDREGGDIRRAMGGRATCSPGAWSAPVVDGSGDLYVGSQVGELQRWGTPDGNPGSRSIELLSSLSMGAAFQDQSISFAPGLMAVSTCTSLVVFQTSDDEPFLASDTDPGRVAEPSWVE